MKNLSLTFLTIILIFSCTKEEHYHEHILETESIKGSQHVVIEIHNDFEQMTFALGGYSNTVEFENLEEEAKIYKTPFFNATLDWGNGILYVKAEEGTRILSFKPQFAVESENVTEELSRYQIDAVDFEIGFEQELGEDILQTGNSVFTSFNISIQ